MVERGIGPPVYLCSTCGTYITGPPVTAFTVREVVETMKPIAQGLLPSSTWTIDRFDPDYGRSYEVLEEISLEAYFFVNCTPGLHTQSKFGLLLD